MALRYRMPVEDVLNRFTSEEQSRVSSFSLKKIVAEEEFMSEHFSFAICDYAREKLVESGIYLSPFSHIPHPHPVCKILENNLLYNVLPSKIDDSFYFIGIKNYKLNFLKKRGKKLDNLSTINRFVTSLDKFRYSNDFVISSSQVDSNLESKKVNCKLSPTLRDLLPECIRRRARNFFLHDELHFWNPDDMLQFIDALRPNMILATLVVPPEILIGAKESLNPWCYKFEVLNDKLAFFPDGHRQGGYIQPVRSADWLKLRSMELPDGTMYSIDLVHSSFSHHLICISQGREIGQELRFFSGFDASLSLGLQRFGGCIGEIIPISPRIISKIYRYLRTLKRPDVQSAMAKLSQIKADPTPLEIRFTEAFAIAVIKSSGENGLLKPNWLSNFAFFFQNLLPNQLACIFTEYRSRGLDQFVSDLQDLVIRVKTEPLSVIQQLRYEFNSVEFDEPDSKKVIRLFDQFQLNKASMTCEPGGGYLWGCDGYAAQSRSSKDDRATHDKHSLWAISKHRSGDHTYSYCPKPGTGKTFILGRFACEQIRCYLNKIWQQSMEETLDRVFVENKMLFLIKRVESRMDPQDAQGLDFLFYWQTMALTRSTIEKQIIRQNLSFHGLGLLWFLAKNRRSTASLKECEGKWSVDCKNSMIYSGICEQITSMWQNQGAEPVTLFNDLSVRINTGFAILDFGPAKVKFTLDNESHAAFDENNAEPAPTEGIVGNSSTSEYYCFKREEELLNHGSSGQALSEGVPTMKMLTDSKGIISTTKAEKQHADLVEQVLTPNECRASSKIVEDQGFTNVVSGLPFQRLTYDNVELLPNEENTVANGVCDSSIFYRLHSEDNLLDEVLFLLKDAQGNQMKGHKTFFFSHCPCLTHSYNGVEYRNNPWPTILSNLLPQDGVAYNSCVVQIFEAGAKVGYHSDDEKRYSGHPIFTLNLYGDARVSFKNKGALDFGHSASFDLTSGVGFTMLHGFQSRFKHAIEAKTEGRISLVFRVQSLGSNGLPVSHLCGLISNERSNGSWINFENKLRFSGFHVFQSDATLGEVDSLARVISSMLGFEISEFKSILKKRAFQKIGDNRRDLKLQLAGSACVTNDLVALIANLFGLDIVLFKNFGARQLRVYSESASDPIPLFMLHNEGEGFHLCMPKNGCVIRAIASALERNHSDIIKALSSENNSELLREIAEGNGVQMENLEDFFKIFQIEGTVQTEDGRVLINKGGKRKANFILTNNHLEHVKDQLRRPSEQKVEDVKEIIAEVTSDLSLKNILKAATCLSFNASFERAKVLSGSLLEGTTGVISDDFYSKSKELLPSDKTFQLNNCRKVYAMFGTAGSGKSRFFKKNICNLPGTRVVVVSPRKMLITGIKRDVAEVCKNRTNLGRDGLPKNMKFLTFEVFLQGCHKFKDSLIILDELQLFPGGFLDLTLYLLGEKNTIFLTGDPLQSLYDSARDRHILAPIGADIVKLLDGCEYSYNFYSWRFENSNFNMRLPLHIHPDCKPKYNEDHILLHSIEELAGYETSNYDAILVASFEEKRTVRAHVGGDVLCLTFGEATGLTFEVVVIICSAECRHVDENRWFTALTRARRNIIFVNEVCSDYKDLLFEFEDRHLGKFLSRRANAASQLPSLPGIPVITKAYGEKVGKDEGVVEDKVRGDPWLSTMLFLGQHPDVEECVLEADGYLEAFGRTHIPQVHVEGIRAGWVDKLMLKESREFRIGELVSDQFPDDHFKGKGQILTNAAERYEAIYPRHKGTDTVTFLMAVRKRLKFSNAGKEWRKFREAKKSGKFFLQTFLKMVKLDGRHDSVIMDECVKEFEEKKTSKSAATIENHKGRSERDWFADEIFLFMKSQHCTKWGNRFRDAKAGQTLACFHHAVLCRFAPYMRYIEKKVVASLPKNLYIHSGKGLHELNDWVVKQGFNSSCTESDYEAFDSSQDHYIMAFEVELMKFLGLPQDLISDYILLKTTLGCKLGSFAIMRFTGEASTFLFNTLANMLFTSLRYDLNGSESICFAGDDMCANTILRRTDKYKDVLDKIRLKAKVEFTDHPTFCGWCLTKYGIFKKPQLVFERIMIALERDNIKNCLDSYAIEVSFAYSLGELLTDLLDEEEMQCHFACVRYIIKHKHLLKSEVVSAFTNL